MARQHPSANGEILRLAIPSIIANITTPLLGLADTAVTGHMGGAAYVGAIAVGSGMFSLAYWTMGFLRMGTSGLAAQACGAGRGGEAVLWRAMALAAMLSAAIIAVSPWLADALLAFLDASPETSALGRRYFMILVWGAPAVLGTYSISGWLLGMQDSRGPMLMALLSNVANIAISVALVFGAGMKIEGVAIGTLAAQWLGLGLGLWLALRKPQAAVASWRRLWRQIADAAQLRRYFNINADIFLRTLCLAAVTLWFTRTGAQQGTSVLAANALLMQLFILFSYFIDGFAFAGEAICGRHHGSGDRQALCQAVRTILRWGWAVAGVFTLAYLLGGQLLLRLLTDEASVADVAVHYLPWAIAVPAAGVSAFVWDGIFVGLTLTRRMLLSMAAATAAFFIICLLLGPRLGNHGLWAAFISYLAIRGAAQWLLYRRWLSSSRS